MAIISTTAVITKTMANLILMRTFVKSSTTKSAGGEQTSAAQIEYRFAGILFLRALCGLETKELSKTKVSALANA
jgi:hypothetical protein